MRWSNVLVIFRREVRDQLRDRRTLFMIFVLPILLYPILGMGVLQFSAAFEQKPRTVVVVGAEFLPEAPPLLNARGDGFDPTLFDSPEEAERLRGPAPSGPRGRGPRPGRARARSASGSADAVVAIPADVREQLEGNRSVSIPIDYFSTDERSQITYLRVREVLARWKDKIVSGRLARDQKPAELHRADRVPGRSTWPAATSRGERLGAALPVPAGHDVADRGLLSRRSTSARARRSGGRWRPCSSARPRGARSSWASS